ncbi:MAG: PDZ domain-containing protein [Bacteroidales bacterium]|nr:PDZ domain-containing protein [Bacteroidales bacterium]
MKKILFTFLMLTSFVLFAQEEARLMRFPAIYGNQVVFTYAGDLYTVDKTGGAARKLTNHEGFEMFAHFSPDGKNLAFTAQYDGNTEVYLMPAEGGNPTRLTYTATVARDDMSDRMGPNNIVLTWKNTNEIIFRSRMITTNDFVGQLFNVNIDGEMPEQLPLPAGGWCSFSPDGKKMAYNRIFRTFRTWKYYKGGMAPEVWIYDFDTKESVNITNNESQDIFPMWSGNKIYFISDRDRTMNLFVYDLTTKATKKLTNFTDYDIKFPSLGNESIIFEKGGFLFNFDLKTEKTEQIHVKIVNDQTYSRARLVDFSQYINRTTVSPAGERLVVAARGDLFNIPTNNGITKNLTETPNAHDRNCSWSPDGKYIAWISDKSGEDEIWMMKQDGSEDPQQITDTKDVYKYDVQWSPDSKKIFWSDQQKRLRYLDVASKKITDIATSSTGELRSFDISPDSRWVAYVQPQRNAVSKIMIYNLETKDTKVVTSDWYDAGSPAFDRSGKYLFFTSNRDFNPTYSWIEWNHIYQNMEKIFFVTLQKDTPNPFALENDVVKIEESETATTEKSDKKGKKEETPKTEEKFTVNIDFDGITDRILALPIASGSYWNISAIGDKVYYNSRGNLKLFDLNSQEETALGNYSYDITSNGKKMVIYNGFHPLKFSVIDLPTRKINVDEWTEVSDLKEMVDVRQEWQQIYNEAWRQMRDYFYDENMHGADWDAVYQKYNVLIPYVNHRHDLNYVIGEMIGELNCGHAYVNGGDYLKPQRIQTGLLGAQFEKDGSGYFKITKILKGENWTDDKRSPLTEVGVNVKEGDFILKINGKDLKNEKTLYRLLLNTVDKEVELTVNSTPDLAGSRTVLVTPIGDESLLYYYNWVQDNIRKVNEATNGEVGYIHIPDMGPEGLTEFVKHYYPQLSKRALIIDDRGNGGGNVSPMIIERLRRELMLMAVGRNETPYPKPDGMMNGPKVLLLNEYSASDGDLFPYQFREAKLGKLIGRRSWGGVVGIRGSLPFIDGSTLNRPEFAHYDKEGKNFIIEGRGVEPDIDVINDAAKEFSGEDQQLNKAIEVILEELKNWSKDQYPAVPQYPVKN